MPPKQFAVGSKLRSQPRRRDNAKPLHLKSREGRFNTHEIV